MSTFRTLVVVAFVVAALVVLFVPRVHNDTTLDPDMIREQYPQLLPVDSVKGAVEYVPADPVQNIEPSKKQSKKPDSSQVVLGRKKPKVEPQEVRKRKKKDSTAEPKEQNTPRQEDYNGWLNDQEEVELELHRRSDEDEESYRARISVEKSWDELEK